MSKPEGVVCVGDVCYAPGQAPAEVLAAAGASTAPAGALALLGEELVMRDGAKLATNAIVGKGKASFDRACPSSCTPQFRM